MAKKRMFDLDVVDTDFFLDMPTGARLLYYDLGMRADDDGFVSNHKKIIKMTNASEDDLSILFIKKFVIPFDSGICVIRHWKINNYLRGDRYKETIYKTEKAMLNEDNNGIYDIGIPMVYQGKSTLGIPNIIKDNIIKDNKDNICEENKFFENEEVNKLFIDYLDMRKKKRSKPTEKAIELVIKKLNNYNDVVKKKMIENSIINNRTDIYELKKDIKQQGIPPGYQEGMKYKGKQYSPYSKELLSLDNI